MSRQAASGAIKEAQIDYVFKQLGVTGWPHTAAVLLTTWVLWSSNESGLALTWGGWMLLSHGVRTLTLDRVWQQASLQREAGAYNRVSNLLVAGMAYAGCLWGLVAWWFMGVPQTESVIYISIALAGMCASTLPALSAYIPAYLAFIFPILFMLIVQLFALEFVAAALLGVACCAAFVVISIRINRIITVSITLDFQNRELLEQVTDAKEKAESANRAKSRFLAVASHDLRQPLQALGLTLESLKLRSGKLNRGCSSLIEQG